MSWYGDLGGKLLNTGTDYLYSQLPNGGGGGGGTVDSGGWVSHYMAEVSFGFECPGSPALENTLIAISAAPLSDIDTLIARLAAGNKGKAPSSRQELMQRSTAYLWIGAAMGGRDCVAKSDPGLPQFLKDLVNKYGQSIELGLKYENPPTEIGNETPTNEHTTGSTAKEPGSSIDDVVAGIGETLENILKGATAGAKEAAGAASTASGQSVQTTRAGIDPNLLLIGGLGAVAVIILLMK